MMMVLSLPPCVVAPFLISQCYNVVFELVQCDEVVAPFLISQCYNCFLAHSTGAAVVAPFLISQCYNRRLRVFPTC